VTRTGKRRDKMYRESLTVLLLPQVTGDQGGREEEEKKGRESLTVLLLPQVTCDQEWK
jgi:hypothetical protein